MSWIITTHGGLFQRFAGQMIFKCEDGSNLPIGRNHFAQYLFSVINAKSDEQFLANFNKLYKLSSILYPRK